MNFGQRSDLARTVLRVAAAVLVGGWCSAAVVGLLGWTVAERVAALPVSYAAPPLLAVFLVTYLSRPGSLVAGIATGWIGFAVGSIPVLMVLPGEPSQWLGSLSGLSAAAVAMAGLAAFAGSRESESRHRLVGATAGPTS
jgi:hypothetical protein